MKKSKLDAMWQVCDLFLPGVLDHNPGAWRSGVHGVPCAARCHGWDYHPGQLVAHHRASAYAEVI